MSKPKRGPALFDLLPDEGEVGGSREVKTSWTTKESYGAARQSPKETAAGYDAEEKRNGMGGAAPEPFFALDGDRIRLSFGSFTAGVTIFAMMVLLIGSYEWGRRSGDADGYGRGYSDGRDVAATGILGSVQRGEPATHLVGALLDNRAKASSPEQSGPGDRVDNPAPPLSGWVQGLTYVVAQEFNPGRTKDAERARAFLEDAGIGCEIVKFPTGSIQLISKQGFDLGDSAQRKQAEELKNRIHIAGQRFSADGGGYKLEGYFKTLTKKRWS